MPESLRGTKLRKHIATYTAMLGIEQNQVEDLANFMGHNTKIHKDIYRVPVPFRDVADISQLLVAAMGGNEIDNENSSSDGSGEDDEIENGQYNQTNNSTKSSNCGDEISPLAKKRSTSPFGKTKRIMWTDKEREAVVNRFGNIPKMKNLPTFEQCSELIEQCPELHRRKPHTLKTGIDNQRKLTNAN